jgi:hypothetical protein
MAAESFNSVTLIRSLIRSGLFSPRHVNDDDASIRIDSKRYGHVMVLLTKIDYSAYCGDWLRQFQWQGTSKTKSTQPRGARKVMGDDHFRKTVAFDENVGDKVSKNKSKFSMSPRLSGLVSKIAFRRFCETR